MVYAGAAGAVLEPTPGNEKLKIRCALDALHAGGSTAGGEGLALAYALAEQQVRPERRQPRDPRDRRRLQCRHHRSRRSWRTSSPQARDRRLSVGARLRRAAIYNDVMMQTPGAGRQRQPPPTSTRLQEARKRASATSWPRPLFPIADDVKIQVEFNPGAGRRVPADRLRDAHAEPRGLQQRPGRRRRDRRGPSVTALYEITPVGARAPFDRSAALRAAAADAARPRDGELAFLQHPLQAAGRATSRADRARRSTAGDRTASVDAAPEHPLRAGGGRLRPGAARRPAQLDGFGLERYRRRWPRAGAARTLGLPRRVRAARAAGRGA